jgi:4'-phosphopantetheinyl transferase
LCDVLARYLPATAIEPQLVAGTHGKPSLSVASELEFNLSHRASDTVIAVTRAVPIGIDLERRLDSSRCDALVDSVLSATERELWDATPSGLRARLFGQIWTRKEAALKAIGIGLLLDPRDVTVGAATASGTRCLVGDALTWIYSFEPEDGQDLAVATVSVALSDDAFSWFDVDHPET